jgi:HAE1 family hydrophobic/amphiphilic exporter-1
MVIKQTKDGSIIQLRDVGRAELGAENYSSNLSFNGHPAIGIGVEQLSNANALDVEKGVKAEMATLAKTFPPGLQYQEAFNTTTAVRESIQEVLKTLGEAILIVIIVIFFFLQTWRSTLIPASHYSGLADWRIRLRQALQLLHQHLTLFGITLATGLVVDDAIVVIENVERHLEEGIHDARRATSMAMSEVTSAVIATSIVLIAVFVPVSLFPGTTGRLYQQFALTIAFSIALSAFNALTLTPALACAAAAPHRPPGESGLPHLQPRNQRPSPKATAACLPAWSTRRHLVVLVFPGRPGAAPPGFTKPCPPALFPMRTRDTSLCWCRRRMRPRWSTPRRSRRAPAPPS